MLDPDLVLSAVIEAFQSIPALVLQMAGDPDNIIGHTYAYGAENSLLKAVYEMVTPSVLVAYLDVLGGNFDGQTIWKHRLEAYIRPNNAGMSEVISGVPVATPPHIWWLMINSTILGTTLNIRQYSLMGGNLQIMDTPSLTHRQDEVGADLFIGTMVIPEYGDN
jgi:hypothetical protein